MSEKSIDLLFILRQNKDISCSTIDSLIKCGFDSNEALIAMDFESDFNQINDISSEQKLLVSQVLNKIKENINNSLMSFELMENNKQLEEEIKDSKQVIKNQKIDIKLKEKEIKKLSSELSQLTQNNDKLQYNEEQNHSFDDTIEETVDKDNKKLFVCSFENCNKKLMTKTSLRDHTNRHLGLKQFKCQQIDCKKSFYTSQALKNHFQLIHSGLKPYKCYYNNCDKSYGRKEVLNNHIKLVHKQDSQ